jgi:hypothetical protein
MHWQAALGILAATIGIVVVTDAAETLGRLVRRGLAPTSSETGPEAGIVRQAPTLEERLAELADLMGRSTALSEQVSAELDARAATARQLQEEARQAEELASINREQAKAIRRLMDADLATKLKENSAAIRKDVRKDAIRIGIGSFFAGGGLTLLITLLVHPLH